MQDAPESKMIEHMSAKFDLLSSPLNSLNINYSFELAIVHEDEPARRLAVQLYDNLYGQLSRECYFTHSCWSLEELSEAWKLEEASAAAARADMVVLALNAGRELPALMSVWIESWVAQKEWRKSALVVLVGNRPAPSAPDFWPVRGYLQKVAQMARMDFFFHAAESAPELPYSLLGMNLSRK